jgi:hypothetical protein
MKIYHSERWKEETYRLDVKTDKMIGLGILTEK